MYANFYGFTDFPFNNTPDPNFFFMSAAHQQALLFLMYGIRERKGLITITGKAGTGKTTLLQVIQKETAQNVKMIFFLDTGQGLSALLSQLLEKIGISGTGHSRDNFELLREGLLHQVQQGISVVLVIEEAQNLEWRQLEQIRLLLNLETVDQKLLQIILVGQPELQNKLNQPTTRQLKQRVDISCRIDYLSEMESFHYIEHRLNKAGRSQQDIFSYEAMQEIYRRSQGIPRLINNICDKALLVGFSRQQQFINRDIVRELSSFFESQDKSLASPRLVQKNREEFGLYTEEKNNQLVSRGYPIVNANPKSYSSPETGGDDLWKFLQDGLRLVLGQGQQTKGPYSGEGENLRLPDSLPGQREQEIPVVNEQRPPSAGQEEGKPPEAPPDTSAKSKKSISRKPFSSEYIKHFENASSGSSGKEGKLKRCLSFFKKFLRKKGHPLLESDCPLSSTVIEDYQKIKNNLFLANPSNKIQTLLLSSSNPGEGTSTVALNFAVTFALTEEVKVLLVDANFRNPKLHSFFGLPRSDGLGEVLREKVGWKDSLRSCKIPNLFIITAGESVINPLYLIKSATLEKTIQEFREHFDYILFDSCAINAYSDPILLGTQMDGLILVVQAGKTRLEVIQRTKKALSGAVNIMGVVLNRRNHYIPQAIYRRL